MDRGTWWTAVRKIAKSRLKQLGMYTQLVLSICCVPGTLLNALKLLFYISHNCIYEVGYY